MTNGPVDLVARLRRRTEALLEATSPEALATTLLAAALELGCRSAALWRCVSGDWQPVAARGEALSEPAPDLVRAVLAGRLPASVLGGSRTMVQAGASALVVDPAPGASDVDPLEDLLEGLLLVAGSVAEHGDGPPPPFAAEPR